MSQKPDLQRLAASARRPDEPRKTLGRLLAYMSGSRLKVAGILALILINSAAGVAGAYLLKPLINVYIVPLMGQRSPDLTGFIRLLVLMGSIYATGSVASLVYSRMMVGLSSGILLKIREELFRKMQKLPVKYFDTRTHGELMSHFTNDTDALREMLSQGLPQLMSAVVTVVGVFGMMLVLSPVLTLIVVCLLGLIFLIAGSIGKRTVGGFRDQQAAIGSLNGYIEEMIEGQKVVRVFHRETDVAEKFTGYNRTLQGAASRANTYANILMPIVGNLAQVQYAIIAAAGAGMAVYGLADIGTIASFLQYSRAVSQPVMQLSQLLNSIMSALAGAERIFRVIDEQPEEDAGTQSLELAAVQGDVRLESVRFSYDGETKVLDDVSFYAKPGQKIALVGATGAGKTTIANLLTRFYDIEDGRILFDGQPVREIAKRDLRRSIGLVLQDTVLFSDTVMENIRYGRPDATDEEVIAAARSANAHSFIEHLPEGYQTYLARAGAGLSAGQRQLIAIARVAVADSPVLILDEATSSIDTRTEALIQKGMDRLMIGRTVFVIAHRLSTVRNADAILVIDRGRIIERGSHEQLLEEKGRYYQLCAGLLELE